MLPTCCFALAEVALLLALLHSFESLLLFMARSPAFGGGIVTCVSS